jgi:hypothetical protein
MILEVLYTILIEGMKDFYPKAWLNYILIYLQSVRNDEIVRDTTKLQLDMEDFVDFFCLRDSKVS